MEEILLASPSTNVVCIIAASALHDPDWRREWVSEAGGPIERVLVLVDTDPFALIDGSAVAGGRIQYSFARVRWEEPGWPPEISVFCFVLANEPTVLYFSPCSPPYRDAVAAFIRIKDYPASFENAFMDSWRDLLSPAISHTLREEGKFGSNFWLAQ